MLASTVSEFGLRSPPSIGDDVCLFHIVSSCSVVCSVMFSYVPLRLVCVCAFPYMVVLLDSYDREDRGCTLVYKGRNPHLLILAPCSLCARLGHAYLLAMVMFAGWL